MKEKIKSVKGTLDILPSDTTAWQTSQWQFLEDSIRTTVKLYDFKEIRTPAIEYTNLFARTSGESSDVVSKEMYSFNDPSGKSVTLRPEGTASVVRAFIENGLYNLPSPQKYFYFANCYRYAQPQAGRYREFRQFGVECFGSALPACDAEVISIAKNVLDNFGVDAHLEINSIGCGDCHPAFVEKLTHYFSQYNDQLCPTCLDRLNKNPMRILDCKSPVCKAIGVNAPKTIDHLCDNCDDHFGLVKTYLKTIGIDFTIEPAIVRGLDYYNRTVFEFVSNDLGAQSTVCGGGRYDPLVEMLGGPATPGMGFGMGMERLILIMHSKGFVFPSEAAVDIYLAPMGERALLKAIELTAMLRKEGFSAQHDLCGKSVKAQMKYADKLGAKTVLVIGDDELAKNSGILKNMATGTQIEVDFSTGLLEAIYEQNIELQMAALHDSLESSGLFKGESIL